MALEAGHRDRAHLAGLDVRQRRREPGEQRLRLAAEDVGDRGADAAIRNVHDIEVGRHLQLLHREVGERSRPRRTVGKLSGVALRVLDEFAQRGNRHRRRDDEDVRRSADHGDRREVLDGIVGKLAHRGIGAVRPDVTDHQRVAVGRRARGGERADDSATSALVLDDDRLGKRAPEAVGDRARDEVDAAARLHRRDDLDRAVRICRLRGDRLRCEGDRRGNYGDCGRDCTETLQSVASAGVAHVVSSVWHGVLVPAVMLSWPGILIVAVTA